jgi:hypothetical protein
MKPTKQQKVLGAVLGVGLVAITLDRLTASSDGPADAADASAYAVPRTAPAAGPRKEVAKEEVRPAAGSLATRLQQLAAATGIDPKDPVDAFAARGAAQGGTSAVPGTPALTPFQAAHRLTGTVVTAEGGGHAMVDGKLVRLGQSLDGYRLVGVGFRKVVFERKGVRYDLGMPESP